MGHPTLVYQSHPSRRLFLSFLRCSHGQAAYHRSGPQESSMEGRLHTVRVFHERHDRHTPYQKETLMLRSASAKRSSGLWRDRGVSRYNRPLVVGGVRRQTVWQYTPQISTGFYEGYIRSCYINVIGVTLLFDAQIAFPSIISWQMATMSPAVSFRRPSPWLCRKLPDLPQTRSPRKP